MSTETRRDRALFAARLHIRSGTMLTDTSVKEICEELLSVAICRCGAPLPHAAACAFTVDPEAT